MLASCGASQPATTSEAASSVSASETASSSELTSESTSAEVTSAFSSEESSRIVAEDITLNKEDLGLEVGQSETLIATVTPSEAINKTVIWSIEQDNEVASIDQTGLVTALSVGTATIKATIEGTELTAEAYLTVTKHYEIGIISFDGIVIEAPEEAEAGEDVAVVVAPNEENTFDVTHVLYNDSYAVYNETDGAWHFTMPEEDVFISVQANEVVAHSVSLHENVDTNIVELIGESFSAKRNTLMHYELNIKDNGYYVTSVRFAGQDTNLLDVETGVVEFLMPDEDVVLVIDYYGEFFSIGFDEELPFSITYDRLPLLGGEARYNSTIEISCTDSEFTKVHKLVEFREVGGDGVYPIVNGTASFTMPAKDLVLTLVSETITKGFTLTPSENVALNAYYLNENSEYVAFEENNAYYGQRVFLKATVNNPDTITVTSLKATYETTSYYNPTMTIDLLDGDHLNEDGYYFFDFPEIKEGTTLSITVEEKNAAYKGAAFLGTYLGVNITSANYDTFYFSNSYGYTIDETGTFTGYYDDEIGSINSIDGNVINVKGVDYWGDEIDTTYEYHDGIMIAGAYLDGVAGEDKNFNVAVKVEEGYTASHYSINAEYFGGSSGKEYAVVEISRVSKESGNLEKYKNLLYVSATNTFYFDNTITFNEGSYVTDNVVDYSLANDGTTLLEIYTEGTGGPSNRKLYDAHQGTYTGFDREIATTLVLDGKGNATITSGETVINSTYEVDEEGRIVVVHQTEEGTTTYTFTITGTTFTLEKVFKEKTPTDTPAFVGHTYKNTSTRVEIIFLEDGTVTVNKYSSKGTVTDTLAGATYSLEGSTITVTSTAQWYTGTIVLTYDETENTMSLDTVTGYYHNSMEINSGSVLSCIA